MNAYCTVEQYFMLHDQRTGSQLSQDRGDNAQNRLTIQFHLDIAASRISAILTQRFPLPLVAVPLLVTQWCADLVAISLYGRRSDRPKSFDSLERQWEDFAKMLIEGTINLPDVDRNNSAPTLVASQFPSGNSQFDNLPDFDQPDAPFSAGGQAFGLPQNPNSPYG